MENEVEAEIDAVDDVEQKEVTPQDQINDMIAAAIKGDYVNANNHFNDILGDRVSTALDQEKTRVASSVYGSDEEDVADEDDVSDEEMEAEEEH